VNWLLLVLVGLGCLFVGFCLGAFVASAGHAGHMYDLLAKNHFGDELAKKRETKDPPTTRYGSTMQTVMYTRKPLTVEAVQVTDENLYEVAQWSGGDVNTNPHTGKKHIQVAVLHPLHQKQSRASVGDWVLKSSQGFKIYADTAFQKGFELAGTFESLEEPVKDLLKAAFDHDGIQPTP